MKTFKRADDLLRVTNEKMLSRVKSLLTIGLFASSLVWGFGCSALDPRRMCEKELADTRAQLEQTSQLANRLSAQLKTQQAELLELKQHSVQDVRREKEQALAQIEIKNQELQQERFEIDRMRELQLADLDPYEEPPKMSVRAR
jgi:hypothetical protein